MIINDTDINSFKVKAWEIVLLLFIFIIPSLFYWYSSIQDDGSWFARSGSLMVMLGAFIEYMNFDYSKYTKERKSRAYKDRKEYMRALYFRKAYDKTILAALVLGTLIWGYGDLLF